MTKVLPDIAHASPSSDGAALNKINSSQVGGSGEVLPSPSCQSRDGSPYPNSLDTELALEPDADPGHVVAANHAASPTDHCSSSKWLIVTLPSTLNIDDLWPKVNPSRDGSGKTE